MSIPDRRVVAVAHAARHRSVDIKDEREPLKQDVVQVVLLPGLKKNRRNRLSKTQTLSEKELEVGQDSLGNQRDPQRIRSHGEVPPAQHLSQVGCEQPGPRRG